MTEVCKFSILEIRNFFSYWGQTTSIINRSKLLCLSILSVGFHPFSWQAEKTSSLWKSDELSAFCQKIGWLIIPSYILLCPFACVCVYTYAIRSYSHAHVRHRAVYLLANENSSTSKTGEKLSWVIDPVLDLVVPRCFIPKSNISNSIAQYF